MLDPEIPSRYIEAHYDPSDLLAVVLINRETGAIKHEFGTAEFFASSRYQAHLRAANAHGSDVYLTVNTLKPDAKRRTKADVETIRHLYLEIDKGGAAALDKVLLDPDMPKPHSVLETSPAKYQVLWQVENLPPTRRNRHPRTCPEVRRRRGRLGHRPRAASARFPQSQIRDATLHRRDPEQPAALQITSAGLSRLPGRAHAASNRARGCSSRSPGRFRTPLAERTGLGFRAPGACAQRRACRHKAEDRHIPAREAQPRRLRGAHSR
jgi:hypothetical protein